MSNDDSVPAFLAGCVSMLSAGWTLIFVSHWYATFLVFTVFLVCEFICSAGWVVVREALFWKPDDGTTLRLHRMAILCLVLSSSIGIAALVWVPNWQDFTYNGHKSLVAVAGSVILGIVAFSWGFSLAGWASMGIGSRMVGMRHPFRGATQFLG